MTPHSHSLVSNYTVKTVQVVKILTALHKFTQHYLPLYSLVIFMYIKRILSYAAESEGSRNGGTPCRNIPLLYDVFRYIEPSGRDSRV